jgi:hypothetical protein
MDAGIELDTPLSDAKDNRFNIALKTRGEHWIKVVVAVRDLYDVCNRLGELGHEPLSIFRNLTGESPQVDTSTQTVSVAWTKSFSIPPLSAVYQWQSRPSRVEKLRDRE